MKKLRSKDVAEEVEVIVSTLKRWERLGLIPQSEKDRKGWRVYNPEIVEQCRGVLKKLHPENQVAKENNKAKK